MKQIFYLFAIVICIFFYSSVNAQNTQIRGFSAASVTYLDKKISFGFSEQDILITSDLTDRLSFLGETVFRYDDHSTGTKFGVEVERVIMKYNIKGNHNLLFGKHHTPINYWNDTYHHGKLFYPTIDRPLLFISNIIPLHTTGIALQGHDLGKLKFGYDLMVGNGLGSTEIEDNDNNKSLTIAAHIKPADNLRIGASYYYDIISKGASVHSHQDDQERHEDRVVDWRVVQNLFSGSVAYFGPKFEILAEGTLAVNRTDTTCYKKTLGYYLYAGYKVTDKITPYFRIDDVHFQNGEIFYIKDNKSSFITGINYQINYLANLKLEYQYLHSEITGDRNKISAQIAIGF
ncbi:MAG TPA: hypothetical protein VGP55_03060 [Chitinophagaceae bacterium]|nr:hypothetical protein [Chitinophagaceae bacterium]